MDPDQTAPILKEQSEQGLHYLSFQQVFCGINALKTKFRQKK